MRFMILVKASFREMGVGGKYQSRLASALNCLFWAPRTSIGCRQPIGALNHGNGRKL